MQRFPHGATRRRIRAPYRAFNARDIDAAIALMTADVDSPNAWEGGRVRGRDAVRAYGTRQWAEIDPTVEPVASWSTSAAARANPADVLADLAEAGFAAEAQDGYGSERLGPGHVAFAARRR